MTFRIDLLCNENIVPLLCFVLTNELTLPVTTTVLLTLLYSMVEFVHCFSSPCGRARFVSRVCATCVVCMRMWAHMRMRVYVRVCRYARLFIDIVNHCLPERLNEFEDASVFAVLFVRLCGAARFVRLHDSRYNGELLQYMPMHGPVCEQVCADVCERTCVTCLYMYSCLYGALLQLDWRCCTINALFYRLCDEYSI